MHLPGQNPITLRRYLFQSLVFLAATIFATTTQAQTGNPSTWLPFSDADWKSSPNWSLGSPPNGQLDQYAIIDNGGTAFVDAPVFTLPGAIEIPSGALEIRPGAAGFGMDAATSVDRRLTVTGTSTLDVRSGGGIGNIGTASIGAGATFKLAGPSAGFSADSLILSGSLAPEITGASFTPLSISGTATLGGTLDINFNGVTPAVGDSWNLIDANNVAGNFTAINPTVLGADRFLQLNQVAGGNGTIVQIVTKGYPEIVVEQPSGTDLGDGSSQMFPNTALGASNSKTFTIRNTGNDDLTGLVITKDGPGSSDYSVSTLGSTTLAPGSSTTFDVTFSPATPGLKEAAIHIASNDLDENPFDINLSGTHLLYPVPLGAVVDDFGGFDRLRSASSVFVVGSIAYVTSSDDASLSIIDVSNPSAPSLLAELKGSNLDFFYLRGARSVHVSGTIAYVASSIDNSLTVLDVSNPAFPVLRSELRDGFGGFNQLAGASSVHVSGNIACVASIFDDSLTIIDVSNPASPVLLAELKDGVGGFNALNGAESVHVSGTTAYVASYWDDSLTIIDVSNPASPVLLAEIKDGVGGFNALNGARSAHVSGNTAYVASSDDDSLTIIDVSNPASPVLLAELKDGVGGFNVLNGANSVHVSGTTAYVASSNDDSLTVIDVSNPASPVMLAELKDGIGGFDNLDGANFVHVSGTTAYVTSDLDNALTIIDLAPVGPGPEITIEHPINTPLADGAGFLFPNTTIGESTALSFTIRNIGGANLSDISVNVTGADSSQFTLDPPSAATLATGDSTTFTITFTPAGLGLKQATIQIASNDLDENPFDIIASGSGSLATPLLSESSNGGSSVYVSGSIAYVASWGGDSLTILDVSDPASPTLLAELVDGVGGFNELNGASDVFVSGNIAYVASRDDDSLTIIDVSNPASPALLSEVKDGVGGFNALNGANSVHVSGTTAYVTSEFDSSLTIIDVSNPSAPALLVELTDGTNGFNRLHGASDVYISGTTAFVAAEGESTLTLIDVTNPAAPVLLAEIRDEFNGFDELAGARSVHVQNTTAYVASIFDDSVTIIDISNPTSPVLLGQIKNGSDGFNGLNGVTSVHVVGTTAFIVSLLDSTLTIVDVSNPGTPLLLAQIKDGSGGFNDLLYPTSVFVSNAVGYVTSGALTIIDLSSLTPASGLEVEQPEGTILSDGGIQVFPNTVLGGSSSQTFTIRNTGSEELRPLGVFMDGPDASAYMVGALGSTSLAPGATTTFDVAFSPSTPGLKEAIIHISSGYLDADPFEIQLRGTHLLYPIPVAEIKDGVGGFNALNEASSVHVSGNTAYVASSIDGSLTVIDVSNPASPVLLAELRDGVGGFNRLAGASSVHVSGNIACVASIFDDSLTIIDVSNPASPVLLAELKDGVGGFNQLAGASSVHVSGNIACVASIFDDSLTIIDVSNPASPVLLAELKDGVGGFNELDRANSVHVSGTTAYVASSNDDSLTIIDVSNPASPVLLAELKDGVGGFNALNGANSVHVSGTTAYVASYWDDSLTIIDVSNPASPVLLAELRDGIGGFNRLAGASSVHVSGNIACVASSFDDSLTVIDVSKPASPALLATLKDGAGGFNALNGANSVHVSGTTAYVISEPDDSLTIIDLTPVGPGPEIAIEDSLGVPLANGTARTIPQTVLGNTAQQTFTIRNIGSASLEGLAFSVTGADASEFSVTPSPGTSLVPGESAVFAVTLAPTAVGFKLASIQIASTDADENPFEIALSGLAAVGTPLQSETVVETLPFGGNATSVYVSGNIAYFVLSDPFVSDSLTILDVSDPAAPVLLAQVKDEVGGFNELNGANSVHVSGTTAYVASGIDDSLTIIDVSDPAAPVLVAEIKDGIGGFNELNGANSVYVSGTTAYVASESDDSLTIIDVSDPAAPVLVAEIKDGVGGFNELNGANSVHVSGTTAYVASYWDDSLTIIDVSNPASPVLLAEIKDGVGGFNALNGANSVHVSGTTAYVASSDDDSLTIIDVSDPAAPVLLAEIKDGVSGFNELNGARSVHVSGTTAYVASVLDDSLTIIDVSNPASPVFMAALKDGVGGFNGLNEADSVHIAGSSAYVTSPGDRSLTIIDISQVSPAPDIVVEQPLGIQLSDGADRSLGGVNVGEDATLTFTIRNDGNGSLTGLAITKDGPDSADFTVGALGTVSLAPGASTTVGVTFAPSAPGLRHAAIHITSNDADESPFNILLSGTGLAPEIVVEQPSSTELINGDTTSFPATLVGGSAPLTFTLRNSGNADLTGLAITKDGTNATDFTVGALGATTLAPAETTTFAVTFAPTSVGVKTAALHIASNDADENPFDLTVTGTGLAPEIVVEEPVGNDLSDGGSLTFGEVETGGSLMKTITVRNEGTSNLSLYNVSVTGTHASEFVAGSPASSVLTPGQTTTFDLTFTPGDLGPRMAALRINSNDGDEALFDLALSGTGVIPGLVVESPPGTPLTSGSTAPLGNVLVGQSETLTLTLRNPGSSPLTGITASKSGFFFTGFTLGAPGASSLAGGETTTVDLTFTPTGAGGKSTTLTIDTAQTDPFTLVVTATGLADTDGDQASNAWENANGFDPNVAGDIDTLDTDGDGDLDIMEIYQGTSRTDPTQHHGLLNPSYSGPGILTVRYRRDLTQSAVVGTPRWSPDLLAWHGSGESVEGVTVDLSSAPVETVPGPPSAEISEMTATVSSGTSDKLFLTIELKPNE